MLLQSVHKIFIKPPREPTQRETVMPTIANHLLKASILAARWATCPANRTRIGPQKV
jgi:hypothetical protein